jgi:ribosome-binding protein aMBF1 (putative translation factor)
MTMDWKIHKKQLLEDKEVAQALKEIEVEYQVARAIVKARVTKGLTQEELAKKLNTTQSVISRVESAKTMPTLSFLKRVATALNVSLQVQFKSQ